MGWKVTYNGEQLDLDAESKSQLLDAFHSGESGIVVLKPKPGYRVLHVAYGPGIPFVYEDDPFRPFPPRAAPE
jgi:hypothetical protein